MSKSTPILPKHQEFLDEHFQIDPRWKQFHKKLKDPKFVDAVRQDTRADPKLRRFAKVIGLRQGSKSRGVKVQGDSGSYRIRYHPENGRFSCTCGDFTYVRSTKRKGPSGECKHIQRMKEGARQHVMQKTANMNLFRVARALHREDKTSDEVTKQKITEKAYRANFPRQGLISAFLTKQAAAIRGQAAKALLAKK